MHYKGDKRYWARDITDYWAEWLIHLSLLAVYLCLTFLLPVPGCPRLVASSRWPRQG